MKKRLFKSGILAIASLSLIAGSAIAAPFAPIDRPSVPNSIEDLEDVFNSITVSGTSSVDVYNDMISDANDSTWGITASGGSVATLIIELAGFKEGNTFGVYQGSQYVEIFDGSAGQSAQETLSIMVDGTVKISGVVQDGINFSSNSFGYYLDSSVYDAGGLWHSDSSLNLDGGYDHMFAYQGTGDNVQLPGYFAGEWTVNEYILAFEDVAFPGADSDFTDFVVMVESVNPIPEPTTMLLFGTGLAGLAGIARRRRK